MSCNFGSTIAKVCDCITVPNIIHTVGSVVLYLHWPNASFSWLWFNVTIEWWYTNRILHQSICPIDPNSLKLFIVTHSFFKSIVTPPWSDNSAIELKQTHIYWSLRQDKDIPNFCCAMCPIMHVNVTNPPSITSRFLWTSPCAGCRNHSSNTSLVNLCTSHYPNLNYLHYKYLVCWWQKHFHIIFCYWQQVSFIFFNFALLSYEYDLFHLIYDIFLETKDFIAS